MHQTVGAKFWPWLSGQSLVNLVRFSIFGRKLKGRAVGGVLSHNPTRFFVGFVRSELPEAPALNLIHAPAVCFTLQITLKIAL